MAELGESADPRALVPGDPAGVRAIGASISRLGAGFVGAADGLRRIDTTDWEGDAANAFRRAFDPIPDDWMGTGEAFLDAADAIVDYADVLDWAQSEAGAAAVDWENARQITASTPVVVGAPDPGEPGRLAAADRLVRARAELRAAGDTATPIVARARDMAPPMPSVAQQLGGMLGDVGGGVANEIASTGQFLWQIDPARFLVEPAEAVQGWQDLGTGLANAVEHPRETVEQALNPRELATNPTRWAASTLTGAGLSAIGGAGAAGRAERVTRAASSVTPEHEGSDLPPPPPVGAFEGRTAAEHAATGGGHIGRPGVSPGRNIVPREVDTPAEVREIFNQLSVGGQRVSNSTLPGQMVLMPDGTRVMLREHADSTDDVVVEVHSPGNGMFKVHVPTG